MEANKSVGTSEESSQQDSLLGDYDLSSMKEMKDKIHEELDQICEQVENTITLTGNQELHKDCQVDNMKKKKLQLQSDIEAAMQEKLLELPDDDNSLLKLAQEEVEMSAADNARTLEFYENKILQLKEEKKCYDTLIEKATRVDAQLDKLLDNQTTEETLAHLSKRHNDVGTIFKALRSVLQYVLNDLYPEQGTGTSLENLLEQFVLKLLDDPHDPYITINDEEETPETHIRFLLRANLVKRHPQDPLKYKFIDPRY